MKETNNIRARYRDFRNSRKPDRNRIGEQEIDDIWGDLWEIQEVDSADQIDQLNVLRYKMQRGRTISQWGQSK